MFHETKTTLRSDRATTAPQPHFPMELPGFEPGTYRISVMLPGRAGCADYQFSAILVPCATRTQAPNPPRAAAAHHLRW